MTELEKQALDVQRQINDGTIWREDATSRLALQFLEQGLCLLPEKPYRDNYGNKVPSRGSLKPGTIGTWSYVVARRGRSWADKLTSI